MINQLIDFHIVNTKLCRIRNVWTYPTILEYLCVYLNMKYLSSFSICNKTSIHMRCYSICHPEFFTLTNKNAYNVYNPAAACNNGVFAVSVVIHFETIQPCSSSNSSLH